MSETTRSSRRAVLAGGAAVVGGAFAVSGGSVGAGAAHPQSSGDGGGSLLDRIVSDGAVRVGVDLGFAPLQYRDPDTNEPTGYSIELTKLMMAELGAEIEYVEIPFSELFAAG
jgi:ABC-type amino acid transport substrate-binding protein